MCMGGNSAALIEPHLRNHGVLANDAAPLNLRHRTVRRQICPTVTDSILELRHGMLLRQRGPRSILAHAQSRPLDTTDELAPEDFRRTAMHPRLKRPMRVVDMMLLHAEHDGCLSDREGSVRPSGKSREPCRHIPGPQSRPYKHVAVSSLAAESAPVNGRRKTMPSGCGWSLLNPLIGTWSAGLRSTGKIYGGNHSEQA